MDSLPYKTMRRAAAMTVAVLLVGMAPNLAFCQIKCHPGEAPATHHAAPVASHHHQSHAAQSHNPVSTLEGNSGCKSLAQVSLLRKQEALAAERSAAPTATPDPPSSAYEAPVSFTLVSRFTDRHGPPVALTPVVPLRV